MSGGGIERSGDENEVVVLDATSIGIACCLLDGDTREPDVLHYDGATIGACEHSVGLDLTALVLRKDIGPDLLRLLLLLEEELAGLRNVRGRQRNLVAWDVNSVAETVELLKLTCRGERLLAGAYQGA